jgi:hypothetical protein
MTTSNIFSLDTRDAAKGLLMACIGAAISVITASIGAGNFTISWQAVWHGALIAGLGYITKNFFSPPKEINPANPLGK